jgi:hypothetical protein
VPGGDLDRVGERERLGHGAVRPDAPLARELLVLRGERRTGTPTFQLRPIASYAPERARWFIAACSALRVLPPEPRSVRSPPAAGITGRRCLPVSAPEEPGAGGASGVAWA